MGRGNFVARIEGAKGLLLVPNLLPFRLDQVKRILPAAAGHRKGSLPVKRDGFLKFKFAQFLATEAQRTQRYLGQNGQNPGIGGWPVFVPLRRGTRLHGWNNPCEILGAICLFRLDRVPVHAFRIADSILRSSLTHSIAVVTNDDLGPNSGKMAAGGTGNLARCGGLPARRFVTLNPQRQTLPTAAFFDIFVNVRNGEVTRVSG